MSRAGALEVLPDLAVHGTRGSVAASRNPLRPALLSSQLNACTEFVLTDAWPYGQTLQPVVLRSDR